MEDLTDSRQAGEGVPTPPSDGLTAVRTERFVTFSLSNGSYAVLAAAVAEIVHPLPLTTLPISVPGLLGIAPLRGEILAVLDIRRFLGETGGAAATDSKSKQIVLKRNGLDVAPVAFTVDRIGEIATLDLSRVRRVAGGSGYLVGETDIDGRPTKVINHSELAAAPRLD